MFSLCSVFLSIIALEKAALHPAHITSSKKDTAQQQNNTHRTAASRVVGVDSMMLLLLCARENAAAAGAAAAAHCVSLFIITKVSARVRIRHPLWPELETRCWAAAAV